MKQTKKLSCPLCGWWCAEKRFWQAHALGAAELTLQGYKRIRWDRRKPTREELSLMESALESALARVRKAGVA